MYDGEVLADIAGHPCIYHYIPPTSSATTAANDITRPLMVFIPGCAHLARIGYGVPSHASYDPSDYLAFHLNRLGYPFLGISYPLEMAGPDSSSKNQSGQQTFRSLMAPTSHGFRIVDWAKQAAQVTAKVVSEQDLANDIVLIAWSMGGRMTNPYTKIAKSLGFNVKALFPLAASPGLQTSMPPLPHIEVSKNGYAMIRGDFENPLLTQIHLQQDDHEDGRDFLPDAVWRRDYIGYPPISPTGWKLRCVESEERNNAAGTSFKFVADEWEGFMDSATFDVPSYPNWIASLFPNCKHDIKHGLTDRTVWASLLAQKLTGRVEGAIKGGKKFSDEGWTELMRLVHSLPEEMSVEMPGTHYFFLGRSGAQRTAVEVDRLLGVMARMEKELMELLAK